jgi:muconolactone delta-isomerase
LRPGEWRTSGLFSAADAIELEDVLVSMPLRVWRSDQVVPLSAHPNDPPGSCEVGAMEYLTTFEVTSPTAQTSRRLLT